MSDDQNAQPKLDAIALRSRKPRIALMGEFSAGKSTLSNLLIGGDALPVQVTATQLPPVWICEGKDDPYSVDISDVSQPVDLERLTDIDVESTKYIRLFRNVDVLTLCDLIDMPGISDPNMSSEVWERVMPYVDAVLWCTHATQAWRQSEAAVWSTMPAELKQKSLLLLTRIDKVTDERDRKRVVARVRNETRGDFAGIFPISLTQALEAGDDRDAWVASGSEDFTMALVDILMSFKDRPVRIKPVAEPEKTPRQDPDGGLKVEGARPTRTDTVVPRRVAPRLNARRPDSAASVAATPQ